MLPEVSTFSKVLNSAFEHGAEGWLCCPRSSPDRLEEPNNKQMETVSKGLKLLAAILEAHLIPPQLLFF